MALVYALIAKSDPTHIRYVGKTKDTNPNQRFSSHLRAANKGSSLPSHRWIRKTLGRNDNVDVIIIEDSLTNTSALQREVYWIAYYKQLGHKLLNMTNGGEGALGRIVSKETRLRLAASRRGVEYSDVTRAKLRDANLGRVMAEETKQKISRGNSGKKRSSADADRTVRQFTSIEWALSIPVGGVTYNLLSKSQKLKVKYWLRFVKA